MVRDCLHRWAVFCFACECCRWRDMRRVEYIQRYLSQDALDRQNGNWMKRPDLISLWRRHVLSNVTPQSPQLGYFDPEKMCVVLYRLMIVKVLLAFWEVEIQQRALLKTWKDPFSSLFVANNKKWLEETSLIVEVEEGTSSEQWAGPGAKRKKRSNADLKGALGGS